MIVKIFRDFAFEQVWNLYQILVVFKVGICSRSVQADVIGQIRKRRGLDPRPPSYEEYYEKE